MIRKSRMYIGLVTIWLLLLGGVMSPVQAYQQANQPAAWRTTPTLSSDVQPNYQFRSTSTYKQIVGHTSYMASEPYNPSQAHGPNRACKDYNPWDDTDPSGLGVGEVDDPAPIGDAPPIMMALMAGIYVIWKKKRKKIHELFAYFKKKQ